MLAALKARYKPTIVEENIRLDATRYGDNAELIEWLGLTARAAEREADNSTGSKDDAIMLRKAYVVLKGALQPVQAFEGKNLQSEDYR